MKSLFNKVLLISITSCLLFACKKDYEKTALKDGVAPSLTTAEPNLVLSAGTGDDTLVVFQWSAAEYGYSAAVKYTLQIAKEGTSFATPKEINVGNRVVQKYTGADFNVMALILGLSPGSAGQLEVRIKTSISDSIPAIYSNVVPLSVTPFQIIINYPSLWVAGDYQGWDPPTAPKISSKTDNGIYEGYVYLKAKPGGTLQFKLTGAADWNHTNYGWASNTPAANGIVEGTLSTAGPAGNLFVPSDGYYLIKANINPNPPANEGTWYVKKTTWGIIGDAPTGSNNWGNDVDMTYDEINQVWTVTTDFIAGNFKFRANADWNDGTNNFGDTGGDLSLEYGGGNIPITAPGTHTITLDLHIPGNYTYKIQ